MLPHSATTASRAGTNDAPAASDTGTQLLRLLVHQSGPQRTAVTITERHDRPVLHIRAGAVLTYASTPQVVAAHLAAWRDTNLAARQVLPASGAVVPRSTTAPDLSELSVIVRQDTTPAAAVTLYPADRTRPGRPACIETVTGPVSVRSYDRQSITDVLAAWMRAAALGAIVWGSPALADL